MKKFPLIIAGALLIAAFLPGCGAQDRIDVTCAAAKAESGISDTTYHGNVEAIQSAQIAPNTPGKVMSVPVTEGQVVNQGDVLFTLDSADAALSVRQAQANYQAAATAMNSAAASKSQNAAVIPAQTASADARANYERMRTLYDQGGVSKVDLDAAKSKMDTTAAQLAQAQIGQTSTYDSAAAQVQAAKASLDIAQKKLSDCTVRSPITGKVTKVTVDTGSIASSQEPVMTIIDDSEKDVVVPVAETNITKVQMGMRASVTVQSVGESCKGEVMEIAPSCDEKTGMFPVKIKLDQGTEKIQAGMTADVALDGGKEATAVLIPGKSVFKEGDSSFVYVVEKGALKKQTVVTGQKKNAYIEITKGIKAGDQVVLQSSGTLEDGTKVRVIKN